MITEERIEWCVLFNPGMHILLQEVVGMLTWELVGAVVGAGLASGREIASFFSMYGYWSYAGIILAVLVMFFLADARIPHAWLNRWPASLWKLLLHLLLIATGGAMLCGAGEISAMVLPFHGAYAAGMVISFQLGWTLAHRTVGGLAWISRILLGVLALLIILGFSLPPMQAVQLQTNAPIAALLRCITYGGFNAALQVPIMSLAVQHSSRQRKMSAIFAGVIIFILLLLGNTVLLRHPALLGEPMPFVRMLTQFGKFGFYLGAACIYLAILSTLTACLRGLGSRSALSTAGILLVAMLGFTGVIEIAYPILGGGCFVMLVSAKFMNSSQSSFQSRRIML